MAVADERPGDRFVCAGGHLMTSQGTAPDPEGSGASSRPGDVVDLDALRAVRLEAVGERRVRLGGREWTLVPEVPFEFGEAWSAGKRIRCAELVLADPADVPAFMALRPSFKDFDALLGVYMTSVGESSAS